MKRALFCLLALFTLGACAQEKPEIENAEKPETLYIEDVKVPTQIFTSEKQNSDINEDEMKASIETYLDSYADLDYASYPFEEILTDEEELNDEELEKLTAIVELTKKNDANFSQYISNNNVPADYQDAAEKISNYITTSNEFLYELDEMLDTLVDDATKGEIPAVNINSLIGKLGIVNGKEQQKIEKFLDEKNIKTKAFGREQEK